MNKLQKWLSTIIIIGSLLAPEMAKSQEESQCEVVKNFARSGEVVHSKHIPWFKIFFDNIPLTTEENKKIEKRFCDIDQMTYYIIDQTAKAIMEDKTMTKTDKKRLILHFLLDLKKAPVPAGLEERYKHHYDVSYIDAAKRVGQNRSKVREEGEKTRTLLRSLLELGKSVKKE